MDSFFPMLDGVTMVMDNYAKRLIKYANVIVFVPEAKEKFDDSKLPYKVVRCKSLDLPFIDYGMPIPKLDKKFKNQLKDYNLDIVHIHSPFMMGELGISYARKHNIPVVATMHSQFKQDFKRAVKIDKLAGTLNKIPIHTFNKCDECWAVNAEVARIFYEDYKCKKKPKVMNNATEMMPVEDLEKAKNLINEKHGISPDEKVLLFVGRINKLKNIMFIADSIKYLKDELNPDLKFKMLFVGSGQDEEELKERIKANKIEDKVIMCGRVSNRELLASYYARADLFVFPSLYDASSIVQIEAASQHTPVVFLKGSATSCMIKDKVNGFLAEHDIKDFANVINNALTDNDLYEKVSNNCFKEIYKNWDDAIEEVYNNYLEIIEKYKKQKKNVQN